MELDKWVKGRGWQLALQALRPEQGELDDLIALSLPRFY
jgi:hypothetical protein